ncbi:hypothetical protein E5F05_10865 [Deinococcus metallilatus]|uniref:Xanthine dehydrogenase molybdopterin-binding subunit B n=1 Tax=Deinococcus metallilatus TaxID=1211322 RepID=A0AAJ5JXL3_9DEIO|nr:hypothetical protein [Deinococcus metallilatus]MBB5296583.1 xanthine dehydrogenase molybdopterin-binding subunit B [Deinococcus metallilatus]QBY08394.1 hypothetical protein E5F05_10865 [Deinococcus metallilatus]RXJ11193.1 hypothetical protein ERJ73_09685 [Deinococcus metallilatus]TLK24684.1 hypothetical protein FCS05_14120 [Deinococcus metallilatus]GMA17500.1 hypothetical protein GCM10025871_38310 [Deinococcus metallilatus]
MRRLLPVLLPLALTCASADSLPPVPSLKPAPTAPITAGLRVCSQDGVRYRVDGQGHVRSLEYGHRYPDNVLHVTQSYDRAGRLTGVTIRQTGFAGRVLDLRGSFDARGRLVKESGYRAPGVTASLRSYLRPVPQRVKC